jgi:hypothetical protein
VADSKVFSCFGRPLTSDEETALHALMNTSKLRGTTLNIHHLKTQQANSVKLNPQVVSKFYFV